MLKNAISKDAAGIRTGLTVEYATGKITNDGVPVIYTFANGARCGGIPGTLPLVSLLGDGGGALTPPSSSSNAGIRVLRVQSCMQRKEAPAYLTSLRTAARAASSQNQRSARYHRPPRCCGHVSWFRYSSCYGARHGRRVGQP